MLYNLEDVLNIENLSYLLYFLKGTNLDYKIKIIP